MGLVNKVVPLEQLEAETVAWCRKMLAKSPLALRLLKAAFNADTDGLAGIQQLAGDATLLYYMSEEAQEGRDAYVAEAPTRLREVPAPAVRDMNPWVAGARPRTLGASVSPVLVGTAAASRYGDVVCVAGRRCPACRPCPPGRRELRQRLLRRASGASTPTARDRCA